MEGGGKGLGDRTDDPLMGSTCLAKRWRQRAETLRAWGAPSIANIWELASNKSDAKVETVLEAFTRFHSTNPDVYRLFRNKARKLRRAGRKGYGSRRIIESMRFDHDIKTEGDDFKINNNFASLYSRLLMLKEPVWFAGFFEIRTSRSPVTDAELLNISVLFGR